MTKVSFQLYFSLWSGDLWMTLEVKLWAFRKIRIFGMYNYGELHQMVSRLEMAIALSFGVEFSYLFNI